MTKFNPPLLGFLSPKNIPTRIRVGNKDYFSFLGRVFQLKRP